MITTLLLSVLFGTAATVVLMIYLIDRVNTLERATKAVAADSNSSKAEDNNGFMGLTGKALWDVMSGKIPEGFNRDDLIALKPRYEQVLQKHIEQSFAKGASDCREGNPTENPKPTATIKMLRGEVQSWLPPQHVANIYKLGYESVNATEENLNHLRTSLDETAETLYTRTDLDIKQPYSQRLLPQIKALEDESGSTEEQDVDQQDT
jgi:hypothetical protein